MILLSHPTGNSFVRAVLEGLAEAGSLESFHTTLSFKDSDWILKIAPKKIRHQLLRRSFPVPGAQIKTHPIRELLRLSAAQSHIEVLEEISRRSVDQIYTDLDRRVAHYLENTFRKHTGSSNPPVTGVYCYEDGALRTFRAARRLGVKCFYDLPIAYWKESQKLLAEEAERLPEWEPTLMGTRDSAEKLARKTEELSLADAIFCPSQFVYRTIPAEVRQEKRCVVAEFGSPECYEPEPRHEAGKTLRVLFAGAMTQRKGLADLFAAMKLVQRPDIELVVMGTPLAPMSFYRNQFADFIYEEPRPHSQVLDLMKTCDLFALPSIVEGRALVQQEAMISGLPIVVTANAGGEDLVEPGKTGFIVPIRCPEAIAEKILWAADNRSQLREMGLQARNKAKGVTWKAYANTILSEIACK